MIAEPRRLSSRAAALLLLALPLSTGAQGPVQRCEGKDGAVTYSNTQCPPGTSPVRKVNTDPPVSVDDRKAAQDRARKDAASAKQLDKEKAEQQAAEKRSADERAKAEAKAKQSCERARRDLVRAKNARSELSTGGTAAALETLQKADREIRRREADVTKECERWSGSL